MSRCNACTTSTTTCPRCASAMCADHMAAYENTCLDCAVAYYDSLERVRMNVWFAVGALVPWTLYAAVYAHLPSWSERSGGFRAITTGFPALDVVIMFAIVSVFSGKAMMGLRRALHRKSFVTRELARARLVRY
jgi:hypothetical protein